MDAVKADRGIARSERLHHADFDHPLREAMEARAFWRNAVLSDPDAGFCIIGTRARFHSVNQSAADILLGREASTLYGLSFFDVFPVDVAAERTAFYQHVLRAERPLLVNSVWRGLRTRERWELLPGDARLAGQVLWQLRLTPTPWPDRYDLGLDVLTAKQNDWGPLASLSPLERQILGHIASGATTAQIAARLDLYPADIPGHRRAIRRKLGARSTAAMIRQAILAGLGPLPR
jgi:DNA-binding CsgD family transcriptional regulator